MNAGFDMSAIVLSWAICFGLSAFMAYWLSRTRSWLNAVDIPNERSLHSRPIPRSGGLAVMTATGLTSAWAAMQHTWPEFLPWAASAVLLVLVISWIDDHRQLAALLRMAVHIAAAALLLVGGLLPDVMHLPDLSWRWPTGFALVFTLLYVVWMTNLFNFMDGMDGFAGGMAVVGFGCMAILGWLQQEPLFALLNSYVALASCGFLVFNFPPARIFLGDVGSSTLGVLAAVFSLWADHEGIFPLWTAILMFSPFIVDATVTLGRRVWRRENIFSAHKSHYYQHLVELGWGHRRTVLCEYALMLLCASTAIGALHSTPMIQWAIILGLLALYSSLMYVVASMEMRR